MDYVIDEYVQQSPDDGTVFTGDSKPKEHNWSGRGSKGNRKKQAKKYHAKHRGTRLAKFRERYQKLKAFKAQQ